ncbi:sensor histidine kinase [Halorhabdus amylolytica]|uniref:sensor histidine kinase n=1 Tax=Halorhabdus amylolytica TaxID=2559573 RepID=UPI0010AA5EF5|nr:HAMP domain-containing sensor histidine kinase [Halorhabdus amylolytica]
MNFDLRRLLASASVSATGVAVFAIVVAAFRAGSPSIYDLGLVVLGGLVGLVLVAGGAVLFAFEGLRTEHVLRVAGWNALGVVVLGLVLVLAVASPSVSLPAAVIANVLGVSAVAHVLIGVTDVRRIRVGELARERQKLAVLNRIVRHNLRNDAQVLLGNSEALASELGDDRLGSMAQTIAGKATSLASMNEKLGDFQAAIDHDPDDERAVDLRETVDAVVTDVSATYPEATIETDLAEAVAVRADDKLADALRETVENAVVHGDGTVLVSAIQTDGHVEISVSDDGPGIPEHELAPLAEGAEITQLEHGTGVGLWVVRTIVDAYAGTVAFDTEDGTTVTIRLTAA